MGDRRILAYVRDHPAWPVGRQVDAIQRWAEETPHVQIVAWLSEADKWKDDDSAARAGLQRALVEHANATCSGIVAAAWHILSDSVLTQEAFYADCLADGCDLHIVDNPDSEHMKRMLVRDVIAADRSYIVDARNRRRSVASYRTRVKHSRTIAAPYGWQWQNSELVHRADERPVVDLIVGKRKDGKTLSRIAEELNAEGHRGRRGGKWTHVTVRGVLEREYPGYAHQRKPVPDPGWVVDYDALLADASAKLHPDFV